MTLKYIIVALSCLFLQQTLYAQYINPIVDVSNKADRSEVTAIQAWAQPKCERGIWTIGTLSGTNSAEQVFTTQMTNSTYQLTVVGSGHIETYVSETTTNTFKIKAVNPSVQPRTNLSIHYTVCKLE